MKRIRGASKQQLHGFIHVEPDSTIHTERDQLPLSAAQKLTP